MMNVVSGSFQHKTNFQNKNQQRPSFGRALTTAETQALSQCLQTAKEKADIDFLAMIMPIAAAPAADDEKNTGIGTFNGFTKFLKKIAPLTGINASQLLPTGDVSPIFHYSPFSSSGFGVYTGYVQPSELVNAKYGKLLEKNDPDLKEFEIKNEHRTNYDNKEKIEKLLDKAYNKFDEKRSESDPLVKDLEKKFKEFEDRKDIKFWLNTYARILGGKEEKDQERYKFKQFIAEEQYKEMQENCGVKLIVDCPIGMTEELDGQVAKDKHNGENPFFDSSNSLACDSDGKAVRWGLPVLHPERDSAKSLMYHKALYHAQQGDGVRIDASQYLMFPSINNGHDDKVIVPDSYYNNPRAIADAFMSGIKDGGATNYLSVAEHLPFKPAYDVNFVNNYLHNNGILNEIPKFSCAQWGDTSPDKWDCFANHDEENIHKKTGSNSDAVKNTFEWFLGRSAKKKQLMFTDVLGYDDSYNAKNSTNDDNWKFRLPENWEKEYHEHLQQGLGFNAPETLNKVLNAKNINNEETNKLKRDLYIFGQILRAPGAKTQEEADKAAQEGTLTTNIGWLDGKQDAAIKGEYTGEKEVKEKSLTEIAEPDQPDIRPEEKELQPEKPEPEAETVISEQPEPQPETTTPPQLKTDIQEPSPSPEESSNNPFSFDRHAFSIDEIKGYSKNRKP